MRLGSGIMIGSFDVPEVENYGMIGYGSMMLNDKLKIFLDFMPLFVLMVYCLGSCPSISSSVCGLIKQTYVCMWHISSE